MGGCFSPPPCWGAPKLWIPGGRNACSLQVVHTFVLPFLTTFLSAGIFFVEYLSNCPRFLQLNSPMNWFHEKTALKSHRGIALCSAWLMSRNESYAVWAGEASLGFGQKLMDQVKFSSLIFLQVIDDSESSQAILRSVFPFLHPFPSRERRSAFLSCCQDILNISSQFLSCRSSSITGVGREGTRCRFCFHTNTSMEILQIMAVPKMLFSPEDNWTFLGFLFFFWKHWTQSFQEPQEVPHPFALWFKWLWG